MQSVVTASRNLTCRAHVTQVSRHYSRSTVLKAEPKLHNATGKWDALKAKRPFDEDDHHLLFHPPYNAGTIWALAIGIVGVGYGSMTYGVIHQQYKQGFWK